MKTIILGDIHGRTIWKDIINKESDADLFIFLGDYVSTHDDISSEQQFKNLIEILEFKEKFPDKVILLRGNHDLQHLGYHWAQCSGLFTSVLKKMSNIRERFLEDTQWMHIIDNVIFSHAGISSVWLKESIEPAIIQKYGEQYDDGTIDYDIVLKHVNELPPSELFSFIPEGYYDYCGESKTQSLTWIRPWILYKYPVGDYNQVVGHTPAETITETAMNNNHILVQCDCLDHREYLAYENEKFEHKKLNQNE